MHSCMHALQSSQHTLSSSLSTSCSLPETSGPLSLSDNRILLAKFRKVTEICVLDLLPTPDCFPMSNA